MAYTRDYLTEDDHSSDTIFPELDEDCFPERMEWGGGLCFIETACGCMVEIDDGDILWMIYNEDRTQMHPVAIDHVTIH